MPDRKIIPPISEVSDIFLPKPNKHVLDNGIPVYEIKMGTQEVLKLEVVFRAGRPFEAKQLVARTTAALLREGTATKRAAEVHEMVDFYGGTLSVPVNLDTSNIVLYSLTKHFDKLLPLLTEVLTQPSFPHQELEIFKKNNRQKLSVDLTKNDVVAYRTITEKIFGETHPYGYNSQPTTYEHLSREDLVAHFQKNYTAANCMIFISGKTTPAIIKMLNDFLGKKLPQGTLTPSNYYPSAPAPEKLKIEMPNTVQTAIRIGCQLFNRCHEDYYGMYILNTILGGYFGSRLMAKIREEKGYTYNIFSSMDPMMFDGYFYVGTEVGNEFVQATVEAIYAEFEILKKEPIREEELKMVRNYLMGFLLTGMDGAFNVAEVVKIMKVEELPQDSFSALANKIRTITQDEIMALAQRYLKEEKMWEVIVGI